MLIYWKWSEACTIKSLTIVIYNRNGSAIVIYNRNDSGKYYKTLIPANLALTRIINYGQKVCC